MGWLLSRFFGCLIQSNRRQERRRLSFKGEVKDSLKKHLGLNGEALLAVDLMMVEAAREMDISGFAPGEQEDEEDVLKAVDDGLRAIAMLMEVANM